MSARTRHAREYLIHAPECPGPKLAARRDDAGAIVITCRACGVAELVDKLVPPTVPRPPVDPGYRCRVHLSEPVDWRGKGCVYCQQSNRDRQEARAARRAARITTERN